MPNFYAPINAQISKQAAKEINADYITDLTGRTTLQLWLTQTNISPSSNNTLGNFTEATFSGYARFNVLAGGFTAQSLDANNNAVCSSALANYVCSGAGVNNTIYANILVGTPSGATNGTGSGLGSTGGAYGSVTVTNPGAAYTVAPKVTASGATGSGATFQSVINSSGQITAIDVITPGSGYTTYTVTVDPPLELIKHNVLSTTGISMALNTDALQTFTQIVQPSVAA
jgi:hypothetical protein